MLIRVDVLTVRFTEGSVGRPSRCYHIYGVTGVVVAANGTAQDRVEPTAKAEAEGTRPGLTMFTDGSRLDCGATGYAVVW